MSNLELFLVDRPTRRAMRSNVSPPLTPHLNIYDLAIRATTEKGRGVFGKRLYYGAKRKGRSERERDPWIGQPRGESTREL
jgi:hypothetical protein